MLHKNALKFIMFSVVKVQYFFELCKQIDFELYFMKEVMRSYE